MDGIEVMAVIFSKKLGLSVGSFVMIYNVVLYVRGLLGRICLLVGETFLRKGSPPHPLPKTFNMKFPLTGRSR